MRTKICPRLVLGAPLSRKMFLVHSRNDFLTSHFDLRGRCKLSGRFWVPAERAKVPVPQERHGFTQIGDRLVHQTPRNVNPNGPNVMRKGTLPLPHLRNFYVGKRNTCTVLIAREFRVLSRVTSESTFYHEKEEE